MYRVKIIFPLNLFIDFCLHYILFCLIMGGKKKKQIKEPDVTIPEGDSKAGKATYEELCATCHALSGDSKNAAAPVLGGLFGTKAGERTNFPYSKGMKSSGITWTDKHLFVYLLNPGKHIPGNKMAFAGLPS